MLGRIDVEMQDDRCKNVRRIDEKRKMIGVEM